jgi:DNA replication protein DnaC
MEARLPAAKTLATFDFDVVPKVSKAQVMALASGDAWLEKGANILLFGPPGGGNSHLSAALGLPWSRTDGAFCLPAPPISCSRSKSLVANCA